MVGFWHKVKAKRIKATSSSLSANDFVHYYSSIMQDKGEDLSNDHKQIVLETTGYFMENKDKCFTDVVNVDMIKVLLSKLKKNSSPGCDGITVEHILYANSHLLLSHLATLCTVILSRNIVPNIFKESVIVPVLKKSTLNPNDTHNYRPITISSVFAKLIEMCMLPSQDDICDNQYGFRQGRDTMSACSLLNDILCYFKDQGTPVFICTLDAEKCFDKIWHSGLFYKLYDVLPLNHWLLLYRWYGSSAAKIRWQGKLSSSFCVTRGTKQGSILSPIFFNYFINDMLKELNSKPECVCIGKHSFNSFAYADDVTLMATTIPSLQKLISHCSDYSKKWRFSFGIKKSKCMVSGKNMFEKSPCWYLNNNALDIVNSVDILGVRFFDNCNYQDHVSTRVSASRRCIYGLQEIGMSYPGLSTEVKVHLWNSMGLPTLLYGTEAISLSNNDIKDLCSAQGSHIKRCLGLSKKAHHSQLLRAAGIKSIQECINARVLSLYKRVFNVDSPTKCLNMYFISRYIAGGDLIDGTLIANIIKLGISPISAIFNDKTKYVTACDNDNGIVDSLRYLIHSENYVKPWSVDHMLVRLLTKAF